MLMGMFKDLREMSKTAKQMNTDNPRPGFGEMISQGKDALADAQNQMSASQLAQDPNARDGSAVIGAIRDTGVTMNENPSVEFDLTVASGGFSYQVAHTQVISRLQVGQMQPGATVNVKFDAEDQNKLIIVSAAAAGRAS